MRQKWERVSVIGLGYIGLPTAAVLASRGISVIGVDVNSQVVDTINRGEIHIVEPDLDGLVKSVVTSGRLKAVKKPEPADAFLIAVPTPFQEGFTPDVSYIQKAAEALAVVLKDGDLVILESTSPVGTTEQLQTWLSNARPDLKNIHLAYCPERVLPGKVLTELIANDRVVGGLTPQATEMAIDLYKTFVAGECLATNARTAEMVKLTENSFRDVNIAFANELSIICDKLGIDVWHLIQLANRHPRVKILQPGPGVGGHCISVDPWFIVHQAPEEARLIRTARQVNNSKPFWVIDKVKAAARKSNHPTIACLGLTFKPDIDDIRESPSLEIVEKLAEEKVGRILVAEPFVKNLPHGLKDYADVSLVSAEAAVRDADVVVLLVDHKQFAKISPEMLRGKSVIDTRGLWKL